MLPHVSFTCWALLAMLTRWGTKSERQGGMREHKAKT